MMAGRGPRFVGGIVAICVCLVFDSVKATAFSLVGRYSCDFNENFSSAINSGRLGFVEEFKMSINGAYGSTKQESQFAGKTFTKLFSVDLKKMKLRVVVTIDGVINDQHDFSFNGTLPGVVPLNGSATYLNRNNRAIQGKIFAACLGSLVSRPDNWRFSLDYLDTISAKIMVEDALSAIERVKLVEVLARAKRRSTEFYQTLMGPDPDLLVCATSDCAIFVSGPSQRSRYLAGGGSWGGSRAE